jgi:hypothetical protein
MLRRLLFAGLLNALLWCGCGGVFAAAMCPHASARAARSELHDCCRARLTRKTAKPSSPDCHARAAEYSSVTHDEHGARAAHEGMHAQVATPPPVSEHPSHGMAHAAREGRADDGLVREGARAARAVQSSEGCVHCVGQPTRPNVPAKSRGGEVARRDQSRPEPRVHAPETFPFASFAPAVIPVQGSPPGASRLHVLLGVFLI